MSLLGVEIDARSFLLGVCAGGILFTTVMLVVPRILSRRKRRAL